jgi:hypothetical protein
MKPENLETIKRIIKEVVAYGPPPQAEPPAIYGQVRPGVKRAAPRPTEVSGRAGGRMAGASGSVSARPNVKVSSGVQPSVERSWKTSGRGAMGTGSGSMSATPKVSTSYSQGGVNVGGKMAAAKQTSPVVKGMAQAGRQAMTKVAPAVATGARALTGVAGTVAGVVAPYAAKEVAKSYEKGHSQGLKPHDVGGEKFSDVANRMKEKSQGRSISSYEKDVLTPKTYDKPKVEAPKVDAPTPPKRPEYFSRGQAFSAARSQATGAGGEFSYGEKKFQTNVKGEPYVKAPKPTGVKG